MECIESFGKTHIYRSHEVINVKFKRNTFTLLFLNNMIQNIFISHEPNL